MQNTGALILAAGGSSRLGQPKQFLVFQDETLLRATAKAAIIAGCHPIVVVAGQVADRVRDEVRDLPVHLVLNANWQSGLGSSIKCGVAHLRRIEPNLRALIILPCDQPFVSAGIIQQLSQTDKPIVASSYADTVGVPAVFRSIYFDALSSLPDNSGAKSLIEANRTDLGTISFPGGAIDIDNQADYDQLTGKSKNASRSC